MENTKKGVEEFQWHTEEVQDIHSPIFGQTLEYIIDLISNQIFITQKVLPNWNNPPLNLAMIEIKQTRDILDLKSTLKLILNATSKEKIGLKFVCQELSKKFNNLSETDLKCAALLFGFESIHNSISYWN